MRKETCMCWTKQTLHLTLSWLLLKPPCPGSRILLAWHDVLSPCLHSLYACYFFLQQDSNMSWEILQIPKVKSVCRFHINQPMERADAVQILSVIRLQLHPWGKNKSQHVSTESLHSYTTEIAHLDTLKPIHTAAKKLKRLCRCLPG